MPPLDLELDLELDRQDRERECELDHKVRDLGLELERSLVAILMIGEREFCFVDDGDLLFLDLDR